MMMRCQIAVVARAVMQRGDLACLADTAKRLERPMNRRERDVRMKQAHLRENLIGTRMVARLQQRLDNRQALWRNRESAGATTCGEVTQPFARIGRAQA